LSNRDETWTAKAGEDDPNTGRPKTLKVTLSDGKEATIKQIPWKGWRKVKAQLFRTLSSSQVELMLHEGLVLLAKADTLNLLTGSLMTPASEDQAETEETQEVVEVKLQAVLEKKASLEGMLKALSESRISEAIPGALAIVNEALDDMTEDLIMHCVDGEGNEEMPVEDVFVLRQAIFAVNDFEAYLMMEKNSIADLWMQVGQKAVGKALNAAT